MSRLTQQHYFLEDQLDSEISAILSCLGQNTSTMDSVAYDTAWAARLIRDYPGRGFEEALAWLRRQQYDDGSWGGEILHYHDRFVCTLAAVIALRNVGEGRADQDRIRGGLNFLWRERGRLDFDADDTIGFPVLAVALGQEASALGLDAPHDIYRDVAKIEKKLNLLGQNPHLWRHTTLVVSLEAVRSFIPPDPSPFIEANGSVGMSPAATAGMLLSTEHSFPQSVSYLRSVMHEQGDGGLPFVKPLDVFEAVWTLNHFRVADAITPDHPEVRRILDFIWDVWMPGKGVTFTKDFTIPDLDDTAVAYTLLRWGGYPVDADVFSAYEDEQHFRCYPGELDMSVSVNMRTLAALQMDRQDPRYEGWADKIIAMLRHNDANGYFWFDKWQISPYYLTSTAIWSLLDVAVELVAPRVQWLLRTQRPDGGWGYYERSTAEETAYCLQALLEWDAHYERIDPTIIHTAAEYLLDHVHDTNYPSLWIGKSLYMPRHLVRSAILMALHSYRRYLEGPSLLFERISSNHRNKPEIHN